MKILTLDIETSPNLAHVWAAYKQNVSSKQMLRDTTILSYAGKFLDSKKMYYEDCRKNDEVTLLGSLNELLDEADMIVGHNITGFDMPKIRGRSLVHSLSPPSPYKEVDTLRTARKEFGFSINTLEHIAKMLGCSAQKSSHKEFPGHELWLGCEAGNIKAWNEMKKYNIQDVYVTEEVYLRMRPYMRQHPNVGVFHLNEDPTCPKCGSSNLQKRGTARTNTQDYQRYQCQECGGWARGRYTTRDKTLRHGVAVHDVG